MGKEKRPQKRLVYEEFIEYLEVKGKLPRSVITRDGKKISRKEITEEEKKEVKLRSRWAYSEEKKKLDEYVGVPIEEIPKKYRDKIRRLRGFGIMGERKLSKVKQQRDEAKSENNKAKELEKEVEEELKRKGRTHAER